MGVEKRYSSGRGQENAVYTPSIPLSQVIVILGIIAVMWLSWMVDAESVQRERLWCQE